MIHHALTGAVAVLLLALATPTSPVAGQEPPSPTPLVRIPFPQDDGTLTPYTFELGYSLMTLVYDTLLWRDADGVPQPWLARAVEPSEDGHRLTIRLAEGVRWHDGQPLTAADVAFTFDYMTDHPHPRFTPQLRAIERVDTPDPATVVVTLGHPSPGFLDQPLADVPILPAHLWRPLGPGRVPDGLPVGSGPYRLVSHQPEGGYRFEGNPDYFRGPPAVAAIEVPVIHDAEETVRALERREVDMVPVSLPEDIAARVRGFGVRVVEGPSYLGTVLMFNLRRPPFDRVEVRQALARTLDLSRMVRGVGSAVAADHGYLHPASPWAPGEVLHTYDEVAARQALADLDLPPLAILAPDNDPVRSEAARQAAIAMSRTGVTVEAREVPRQELSEAVGEDGSPPSFDMAIWTAPPLASYDPDFLRRVFGSDPSEAALNYSGYASPAFDELARRIATTVDAEARRAATEEALRLLATDVPVAPLFFPVGAYVYRPAIYDEWTFVKGRGILDKRSFLEPQADATPPSPDVGPQDDGDNALPFGWIAVGFVGVAGLMALTVLLRQVAGSWRQR